jgi:hypothetical protein
LWVFFPYLYFKRKKKFKSSHISILMFEENKVNSKIISKSSSIIWTYGFKKFSNFNHILMIYYNALRGNQWLLYWFKIQTLTINENGSTIILKMCQIRRNAILLTILIIFKKCKKVKNIYFRTILNIMILLTNF